MLETASLDFVPLWAVFAGVLVGIVLFAEGGYRLGRWRSGADPEKEGLVGGMVAAELGLLAFLLAFTFGIAAARFDDRRQTLLDESNAIGTAYLRAAMLPEPRGSEVRRLLRDYVDARLAGVQEGSLDAAIRRSEDLHGRLWAEATAAASEDSRSIPVGLFVQALNEVIDLHAKRVQAGLRSRIPQTVWVALFAVTALSFGVMGYHGGLTSTRRSPAILAVALTFAAVIWLVADLDRPQAGLLKVSQQPMIELQKSMATTEP